MKRTDFTNNGGLPFTQDRLAFMQSGYNEAFGAMAKLCGDKVILYGVEVTGSNVSDGWIAYDGELIRFIGGTVAAEVIISETPTALIFADASSHNVHFDKTATLGASGTFPFADLQPLISLQNVWSTGDLKQKYCDNAYIAANFDGSGYGLNKEKGWRILASEIPAAAGKVLVNLDTTDADFDEAGNIGGEKAHTLTQAEMPAHTHGIATANASISGAAGGDPARANLPGTENTRGLPNGGTIKSTGGGASHNNLQPYFVVLTLIKI